MNVVDLVVIGAAIFNTIAVLGGIVITAKSLQLKISQLTAAIHELKHGYDVLRDNHELAIRESLKSWQLYEARLSRIEALTKL